MNVRFYTVTLLLAATSCWAFVSTGLDRVDSYTSLFKNKQIGIITNHTAFNRKGDYILDIFQAMENIKIAAVFGPEHGFEGIHQAGEKVDNAVSEQYPVYSLYGQHRKPTPEMLKGIDVLVFDIQDIGSRYYTYIYTMALAMEAAAENGIQFVVLDRPNPINALKVEGNVLDTRFASFVGLYPIPVQHGMTAGELALLFNDQGWLKGQVKANLIVIPMSGYQRNLWYDQTGLRYIKPSPNMLSIETAAIYPGTCLLEGTNVSEGRGTDSPFLVFGAPWIDGPKLKNQLDQLKLPGIQFEDMYFTPASSKYKGQVCGGCKIKIIDRDAIDPFWTGVEIVRTLYTTSPSEFEWKTEHFEHLCGTDKIRNAITKDQSLEHLKMIFQKEIEDFRILRKKYLLY